MDHTSSQPRGRTSPLLLMLIALIIAAIIGWALYFVQISRPVEKNQELNSEVMTNLLGMKDAAPLHLASRFKDSEGDLVADPPDAKEQIDPPTLYFSYVGANQAESERMRGRFKEFTDYLQQKVGRPVEFVTFRNPQQELLALCAGKLHIAGVNTGNVPTAVNQCGFVPICCLASDKGVAKYQMQIIVPADSSIQTLSDLHGHELTLTEPGSNSGFKAPLVLLRDNGLVPARDFTIRYSRSHEASIDGIARKTYQAAAVASDVLLRAMAENPPRIRKDQYRVIYSSEDFPTAGFGYVSNLREDLAAKVKDAFFSFQWKGTGVEREFSAGNETRFAPITFKNDFALVRRIDDAIRSVSRSEPEADATTRPDAATAPTSSPAH